MTNFTVIAQSGVGEDAEYTARYVRLHSVVENIADQGNVDFKVLMDTPGQFQLDVRNVWGEDRRIGNTIGNVPVVFSLERGNLEIPIYTNNRSEEINFTYVGGQGQGVDRTIIEYKNQPAIDISPWNRCEAFTDSRQNEDVSALYKAGEAYLYKNRARLLLTANVLQTVSSNWPTHWGIGDLVTSQYRGNSFDKKIIEINVSISASESASRLELIDVEMEDYNG